jgi:hypothetical protein
VRSQGEENEGTIPALERHLASVPPRRERSDDSAPESDTIRQLELAVEHRTVLGQATGILMERYGLRPEEAWQKLAQASQDTNRKAYALARELVVTGHTEGL